MSTPNFGKITVYSILALLLYISSEGSDIYGVALLLALWLLLTAFVFSKSTYVGIESQLFAAALIVSLAGRMSRYIIQESNWAFMLDIVSILFIAGFVYELIKHRKSNDTMSILFGIIILIFFIYALTLKESNSVPENTSTFDINNLTTSLTSFQ